MRHRNNPLRVYFPKNSRVSKGNQWFIKLFLLVFTLGLLLKWLGG